jgi:hypothetical protein
MKNHWLDSAKRRILFEEIYELGLDAWDQNGTLGDLLASLNDEQSNFLLNMSVTDFFDESSELRFGIEIVVK